MAPAAKVSARKPPALRPGDTIAVVAPASNVDPKAFQAGCDHLRRLGYKVVSLDSIFDQDLYFAGSAARRARELEEMFERDDVRAILCARGGYGSNYLLRELDVAKIGRHPKIFIGYSDITTLLTWFHDAAGLVTFHGPMLCRDFAAENGVDLVSWNAAIGGRPEWELASSAAAGFQPLVEGSAEGIVYGGCLSIVVASLGTRWEIQTRGKILFLEDVNAKPYQVDRMLMQLKLAGKLEQARGLIFGQMLDCVQAPGQPYALQEVVRRVVGELGLPVAYGLRSGHVERENLTLPLGVKAALNVSRDSARLKFLEAAAIAAVAPVPLAQS